MDNDKTESSGDQTVDQTPTEPQTIPAPPSKEVPKTQPAAAKPQEDESDWEELDDVLDHFSASKAGSSNPTTQNEEPSSKQPQPNLESNELEKADLDQLPEPDEEALIKQLEAGMAELLSGGSGKGGPTDSGAKDDVWNALDEQLSKSGMNSADLMKMMIGEDLAASADGGVSTDKSGKTEESFQETIRKTMDRMQESGDKATAAVNDNADEDVLVQMLKAMEAAGMGGDGATDDEGFEKMLMGVMEQLSSKEILYEPVKELHEKFGPWLKDNKEKLSKEDLEKYEMQAALLTDVMGKFDSPGYSDDNPEHRNFVWEKMQEMQAMGSPPKDLVSDPFSDDLLSGVGSQCPQQ